MNVAKRTRQRKARIEVRSRFGGLRTMSAHCRTILGFIHDIQNCHRNTSKYRKCPAKLLSIKAQARGKGAIGRSRCVRERSSGR